MDDWSFREIIEVSSVFVSFFAPIIIALILFLLGNSLILQISIHNKSPSGVTLGNIILLTFGITFFTYVEIRLLKWLTN